MAPIKSPAEIIAPKVSMLPIAKKINKHQGNHRKKAMFQCSKCKALYTAALFCPGCHSLFRVKLGKPALFRLVSNIRLLNGEFMIPCKTYDVRIDNMVRVHIHSRERKR